MNICVVILKGMTEEQSVNDALLSLALNEFSARVQALTKRCVK
jgi:hypothetical protein